MFGWSIRASAWRSASKRAMTCRESMPALISLTADPALTGSVCSAIQTTAHAALADLLQELVRADDRAGPSAIGSSIRSRSGRRLEERTELRLRFEQGRQVFLLARLGARFVQEGVALVDIGDRQGGDEDVAFLHGGKDSQQATSTVSKSQCVFRRRTPPEFVAAGSDAF